MKVDFPIREKLLEIPIFAEQDSELIDWLMEKGEYRHTPIGEYFFKKGDPVDHMAIVLEGHVDFMIETGGNLLTTGKAQKGDITGMLPYSRMKEAGGFSKAMSDFHTLSLHKKYFPEIESKSPELVQSLVSLMSDRVRLFTIRQQQREKMEALGKMSAGIAHELNNPASAITSTSRDLFSRWQKVQDVHLSLLSLDIDADTIKKVVEIINDCEGKDLSSLSLVERSSLEDELIDALDDLGFENSMDLAEELTSMGVDADLVEEISEMVPEGLEPILTYAVENKYIGDMMNDIKDASKRISKLVGSIKTHSHMDRAPEKGEVDLKKGIESTLVIFQHKIKGKNLSLKLDLNESKGVIGLEGELNQVWTNIIDNAIDALEDKGELKISIFDRTDKSIIQIEDNGPGIPPEIKDQIFDPFFTTKEMGKGSGLGLDISMRIIKDHNGEINVSSEKGKTVFSIELPKNNNG